jgi:predicted RNA-binding protein associated with RNAse of E/G family
MPAEISVGQAPLQISYVDLALDLLVFPDGRQLVLDEDEFAALDLNASTITSAHAALEELKVIFKAPVRLRLAEVYS